MRIHCLLHSHLGGEIYLPVWAAEKGHDWVSSIVPVAPSLPDIHDLDCLVIMGGPMSAWEEERYTWLTAEKRLVEAMIVAGKPILGICLGAQIMADVLGARIFMGAHQEIGWHRVETTAAARDEAVGAALPGAFETFLWHRDSFEIPDGATHIARSKAFESQGFVRDRALALQFHLEVRPDWVRRIAARDSGVLMPSEFVQSLDWVLGRPESLYRANNAIMKRLLDTWLGPGSLCLQASAAGNRG